MSSTLFLYGTLKRGQANHYLLAGQTFLGEATTLAQYRLYDKGPYPCLVEDQERGEAVRGELWQVDDAALARIDAFEEVGRAFDRCRISIAATDGPVDGYLYRCSLDGMQSCGSCWPATS